MYITVAWWQLDGSGQTVDSLHDQLRTEGVQAWRDVPELCLKLWIADRDANRWGAVMVWDSEPDGPLPPNRAAELIGRPPAERQSFTVAEAVVNPLLARSLG
ncbi:trans-2,3-dihydro-3-hydroxyanthranilate isomerase [Kibdelosporangium banguiense]|uniref:Trans-2,3-dihydro-3-hydroxyanthranilate isomerase n=1 Tax=Kibdelosporangium banguiense TaxID=1365924 RepID=A0ABS4TM07_9PSEU|nr:hypothetical protein [Kibdelosporangium banguiense]MBP2324995.1 trans-2,3-dihydro-3-hydroxyanthranilate isomerase [Kibdelosporangium banguiense]